MVAERDQPGVEIGSVDTSMLDALREIEHEAALLRERRASLQGMRNEYSEAVLDKVDADYARRLEALDAKGAPLRRSASAAYDSLRKAAARVDADHEAKELEQQEIELRHRIGEFAVDERDRRLADLDESRRDVRAAHERAGQLMRQFEELLGGSAVVAAEAQANTLRLPDSKAEGPQRQDAGRAARIAAAPVEPAATRILPVLDLPEPPKVPAATPATAAPVKGTAGPFGSSIGGAAAAVKGGGATMILRTARLVPQNPEAGRAAIPLPPRAITLGAGSEVEVFVGGPGVDARHAEIKSDGRTYQLVDLGSRRGTLVNAEPVADRLLRDEDVIQIGAARYIFREG